MKREIEDFGRGNDQINGIFGVVVKGYSVISKTKMERKEGRVAG